MKKLLLVSVIGLALVGCGGGESGSSAPSYTPPSSDSSPSIIHGGIDQVHEDGSISIGGRSYYVRTLTYAGEQLEPSLLKEGADVIVTPANAEADIELDPTISGKITERNGDDFTVNGTKLYYAGLDSELMVDDHVLVSTRTTSEGGYEVTSVIKIDTKQYPVIAEQMEIHGRVSSVDTDRKTLILGTNTLVDFSKTRNIDPDLPINKLQWVGKWIEVDGSYNGTLFVATEIDLEDYDWGDQSGVAEADGIITSVVNLASGTPRFSLNFRTEYETNSSTCYRMEDSTICDKTLMNSNLKYGAEVDVKSRYSYELQKHVAIEVEFERPEWNGGTGGNNGGTGSSWIEFDCEGIASNYNAATRSFTMSRCEQEIGDSSLADTTVYIDAMTHFDWGVTEQNLNGKWLEVEGIRLNGKNMAREIELDY